MYRTGIRPFGSVGSKNVPSGFGTTRNWRKPSTCIGSAVLPASAPTIATVIIARPLPWYAEYGGVPAGVTSVSGANAVDSEPKSVTEVVQVAGVLALSSRE